MNPVVHAGRWVGDAESFAAIEGRLRDSQRAARTRWPDCTYGFEAFAGEVGALLRDTAPKQLAHTVDALQLEDLYLARACAAGDEGAIRHLRRDFGSVVESALRRQVEAHVSNDDIAQVIWMHLLVADGERPPKLVGYRGEGKLTSWIRVIAVRTRADVVRRRKPIGDPVDALGGVWDELGNAGDTPELVHLKSIYRERFKTAFGKAVAELDAAARNLLRQKHVFGLTLAELAGVHRVHPATIKRRLARCRSQLIEGTGRGVCGEDPHPDELASVLRLVGSQVDLSLARYLDAADHDASPQSQAKSSNQLGS